MLKFLSNILGLLNKVDFSDLINKGALILDVRTAEEFKEGNVKNSINIALDELKNNIVKLKKDDLIIVVCASGMRSKSAIKILKNNGFTQVYNGGSWSSLIK